MIRDEHKVVFLSIITVPCIWLVDAVVDAFVFHEGSFSDLLVVGVPRFEIYFRGLVAASLIAFGMFSSALLRRRARAEEALRHSERELSIRNQISNIFLTVPDEEMYGEALQVILEALESKHGVFGYIDQDGSLVCPSMTRNAWDQCQVPDKDIVFPREAWGGIWGRALIEQKALYSNERLRVPEGHIPVHNCIAVPIVHQAEVIGLVSVGNKATDYDERDRELLETIADSIAPILSARLQRDRHERERKRAEQALREARDELEVRVKERTAEIARANEELRGEITERKRMEEALRESEEKFRSLVEQSIDGIAIAQGLEVRFVNRALMEMLGYDTEEEMVGRPFTDFVSPKYHELLTERAYARQKGNHPPSRYELRAVRRDGTEFPIEVSIGMITYERQPTFEVIIRDITERKRAEEALREQVRRDPLTGILNHGAIVDELRSLISSGANGGSHAVAMVDVDGLKATNDTFGHQIGDAVLVAVASALSKDGALVGRYGGDEFVVVLPGADRAAAERYREEALGALGEASLRDQESGASVPVEASIGISIYPTESTRIEELIKRADTEMMAAKRQRPVVSAGKALSRPLGSARAAEMVGDIVPLLTSPGELNDKLRLVAHRLSLGAGYDGVNFQVFRRPSEPPAAQQAFARAPDDLVEAWNREQRQLAAHPVRQILERTRRPLILDDPQHDQRLTDAQRKVLRSAGLRSALIAPMLWQNELIGHVAVASKREAAFGPRDAQFLMAVATQVTAIVRTATLVDDLQSTSTRLAQAQTETVVMLAAAAEAHDHTTGLHLQNVRAITEALARDLGHSREQAEELGLAAVLHDIGKIRVPDVVLATAGQLTDAEWEMMKQHTIWGGEFLAGRPGFELAATIARSHHERWDGSGYPDALAGAAIPEPATIAAVADAFDAMISDRPYRSALSIAAAVREIVACSGEQFSPKVVQALVRLHKRRMLPRPYRRALEEKAA